MTLNSFAVRQTPTGSWEWIVIFLENGSESVSGVEQTYEAAVDRLMFVLKITLPKPKPQNLRSMVQDALHSELDELWEEVNGLTGRCCPGGECCTGFHNAIDLVLEKIESYGGMEHNKRYQVWSERESV